MTTTWPSWYCPTHQKPLQDLENALACSAGERFQRINGIPRFAPNHNYAGAFGAQWKRYRLTQLDSYTGSPITRTRAERCGGANLWNALEAKHVLEAGCGAGRFTEVLLGQGARVTSVDLSDAVDANVENFPLDDRHRIAQADVFGLPFAPRQFDVVFCLGVLQHTPNPEQAIAHLYEHVKPGGTLVIDHYTHNLSHYTKSAPLFRAILKRLPAEDGLKVTERLVDLFWPLHRAARHLLPAQWLLSRISPVLCYYRLFPQLNEEIHRQLALVDTHDSLTDWFKHFRTRGQIRRTLDRLGLQDIWCEYGGNGVEARGTRPSAPRKQVDDAGRYRRNVGDQQNAERHHAQERQRWR